VDAPRWIFTYWPGNHASSTQHHLLQNDQYRTHRSHKRSPAELKIMTGFRRGRFAVEVSDEGDEKRGWGVVSGLRERGMCTSLLLP
jgi:hypothetical protein